MSKSKLGSVLARDLTNAREAKLDQWMRDTIELLDSADFSVKESLSIVFSIITSRLAQLAIVCELPLDKLQKGVEEAYNIHKPGLSERAKVLLDKINAGASEAELEELVTKLAQQKNRK